MDSGKCLVESVVCMGLVFVHDGVLIHSVSRGSIQVFGPTERESLGFYWIGRSFLLPC